MPDTSTNPDPATPDGIAPDGALVESGEDGAPSGNAGTALERGAGPPRPGITRLRGWPAAVRPTARRARATQRFASAEGRDLSVGLAPPGDPRGARARHAGPCFEGGRRDLRNLERADANGMGHHTAPLPVPSRIAR